MEVLNTLNSAAKTIKEHKDSLEYDFSYNDFKKISDEIDLRLNVSFGLSDKFSYS